MRHHVDIRRLAQASQDGAPSYNFTLPHPPHRRLPALHPSSKSRCFSVLDGGRMTRRGPRAVRARRIHPLTRMELTEAFRRRKGWMVLFGAAAAHRLVIDTRLVAAVAEACHARRRLTGCLPALAWRGERSGVTGREGSRGVSASEWGRRGWEGKMVRRLRGHLTDVIICRSIQSDHPCRPHPLNLKI